MIGNPQPIEELDALPATDFIAALAPLFEGAPELLWRLAGERPFGSWWNLLNRARAVAQAMPEPDRVELLNAHPRLGAPPETVSPSSYEEQGYGPAAESPSRPALSADAGPGPSAAGSALGAAVGPSGAPGASIEPAPSRSALAGQPTGLRSRLEAAAQPAPEPPRWGSSTNAGAAPRPPSALGQASSTEAAAAPAHRDPSETAADGDSTRDRLARLNAAYEDWFGFRYCVFVAGRSLEALIPELEASMTRPRDEELRRGVDAVIDIAIARSGAAR